jgi:hypothetical protein
MAVLRFDGFSVIARSEAFAELDPGTGVLLAIAVWRLPAR